MVIQYLLAFLESMEIIIMSLIVLLFVYCKALYFRKPFIFVNAVPNTNIKRQENFNTKCIKFSQEMQNLMNANFGSAKFVNI
jgi:hypothetical protein